MKRVFSHPVSALLVGLCLRLLFVLQFPQDSGDTGLYEQLATNWLKSHVYGVSVGDVLTPMDIRVPGYPAYLALIYAVTGRTGEDARLWVMLGQVVVDLATCVVIASLAALLAQFLASSWKPSRVFCVALWLTALCPFTGNYVAVPLTETISLFFTAIASLLSCLLFCRLRARGFPELAAKMRWNPGVGLLSALLGFSVGLGSMFRPETPLLLAVLWLVAAPYLALRRELRRLLQIAAISGLACLVPMAPWAIRNAITLHKLQPLAPKYSNMPGEIIPYGFMKWERTWLYRFRDVYLVPWNLNSESISVDTMPSYAFDSEDERNRIAAILEEYNQDNTLTAEEDHAFGEIGAERTARHPLRTYLTVPAKRSLVMWFTPRIELLPFNGRVWPIEEGWEADPVDFCFTIGFFVLNVVYVSLAIWGATRLWRSGSAARTSLIFFLAYALIRTAFLTTLETPEPRYVLECFPMLLALVAFALTKRSAQYGARFSAPPVARGGS